MSYGFFEGQSVYTRAFEVDSTVTTLKSGTFVALNSAGKLVQAAVDGDAIGVALESYDKTGGSIPDNVWPNRKAVAVRLMGTAFVEAGAAINAGAEVEVDAGGVAVPYDPAAATPGVVVGIALKSAAAAGDMIEVLIKQ